jgi:aspartate 1-decarboxylase
MADEFQLLTREETFVSVKHVGEGHRFAFYVDADPSGRRLSPTIAVRGGRADAAHKAEIIIIQARAFAEREAKKASLID